jgi:recombination protein RecR
MNPKIEKLIKLFAKLPRVGNRGGQRIALALLQDKTGRGVALANAINDAMENIAPCPNCGVLTERGAGVCEFCRDSSRQNGQLCIVRDLSDVWVLEKSAVFHGRYHIIGGLLSGASGVLPQDLSISNLPERIKNESVAEVIFALPNTVEGMVRITSLKGDCFYYDDEHYEMVGEMSNKKYILGQQLKVEVVRADKVLRTIDFEIVDDKLIEMSGGIVQGMSGSPIIQGDYIVGAVTRVLIDDVSKGYGISIVTMLEEGDKILNDN